MRIGIDARELGGHATGVGRYLSGLLREWAAAPALPHEFVLYTASSLKLPLDIDRFRERIVPGTPGTWWEQVPLPRFAQADSLDVFFAPAYTAPLRLAVPCVLTIHDVSYVAHPEWFRLRDGARRRWLTRHSARHARAIVTVSQFSRREIVEHLQIPEERVHVIPQGIERLTAAPSSCADAQVLYVGSILNRRHVPDLIRAVLNIARTRPGIALDLVGEDRSFPPQDIEGLVGRPAVEGRVRWHRYASDDELRNLYGRARTFAFLSEYEGLGMTPLEALAAGVPPVLYDTPVARESCGDAALYAPIGDDKALVTALERALFDESARAAVLAAAPAALAKYDWSRAARETLALLESAPGLSAKAS
jgi:glycosyltransferase involved in cell wall biosynthesis